MSAHALVEKIHADTKAKVDAVAAAAAKEVAALEAATAERVHELEVRAADTRAKLCSQRELVATSRARQAGHIAVQEAKRAGLDVVFADAFTELMNEPADAYIARYTARAKAALPEAAAVTEVEAPEGRLEETASILKELSVSAPVRPSTALSAGLVFFTDDGVFDCSLDREFRERRAELEMQVLEEIMS